MRGLFGFQRYQAFAAPAGSGAHYAVLDPFGFRRWQATPSAPVPPSTGSHYTFLNPVHFLFRRWQVTPGDSPPPPPPPDPGPSQGIGGAGGGTLLSSRHNDNVRRYRKIRRRQEMDILELIKILENAGEL